MTFTVDLLAWIATAIILLSYLLAATDRVPFRVFHCANVAGALFIALSAGAHRAWPSLAITLAFGCIGAVGLLVGKED